MLKSRCTVLFCWMGDPSRFMKPVNVFPLTGTVLQCLRWRRQELEAYRRSSSLQTRLTLPITCCILTAASLYAAPEKPPNSVAEIQSVLHAQQGAWNRGDIDGFMNGYARSPSTVSSQETKSGAVGKQSASGTDTNIPIVLRWEH